MAEVKWIKLSTGLPDNKKIKQIRKLPDGNTIALMWVFLMCLAGETNEDGMIYFTPEIPYTDEMLADQFSMDINTVKLALNTFERFGMIEIVDNIICLAAWEKWQAVDSLANMREKTRQRVAKHREKQKLIACNVTRNVTVTQCNAIDKDIEREEEREVNNNKCASKAQIDSFFDSIWNLYPVKKGKGQVSNTKRKVLYNIGFDEIERAVERYLNELKKDADWRKPQNGSTFFNSGYVDYLDKNFIADRQAAAEPERELTDEEIIMGW